MIRLIAKMKRIYSQVHVRWKSRNFISILLYAGIRFKVQRKKKRIILKIKSEKSALLYATVHF
jgi:hypothetical protein